MSSDQPSGHEAERSELLESVLAATRQLHDQAILFSQAVAGRYGLAVTDATALEQLTRLGSATAGHIAELTGLTTGAVTRMIDRLEQSGFVRRTADPVDRRRVVVEPVLERVRAIEAEYNAMRDATRSAIERYSDTELGLIRDFLVRNREVGEVAADRVGGAPPAEAPDSAWFAPLGGTTSGRLVFISGAPYLTLHGDRELASLYRGTFNGAIPRVRVRDGVVTVRYGRLSWFEWRTRIGGQVLEAAAHWRDDRADIALNGRVPWTLELRGGASKVAADLRAVELAGFDLAGGVSSVELDLPRPRSVVRIRIAGGANDVRIHRPVGVGVRLEVHGWANRVSFDGEPIHRRGQVTLTDPPIPRKGNGGSAGAIRGLADAADRGRIRHETPGLAGTAEYYEIELTGGANRLSVDSH